MKNRNEPSNCKMEPLSFSDELARTVINSLSAHFAILDENGVILETNKAWQTCAADGPHWYYMRTIRMAGPGPIRVVISHEEITALKLTEEALKKPD